jgi:hypothetical protein
VNENNILSAMKLINQTNSLGQKENQDEPFNDMSYLESFELEKKVDGSIRFMGVSFSKAGNYSISFEKIDKYLSNYLNYLVLHLSLNFHKNEL